MSAFGSLELNSNYLFILNKHLEVVFFFWKVLIVAAWGFGKVGVFFMLFFCYVVCVGRNRDVSMDDFKRSIRGKD